jgi:hypothetical protein
METFFLVIFWVIVIFYLLRLGFRYILPWAIKRFIQKMHNKMTGDQASGGSRKSGEVKVNYSTVETPRIDPNAGEYIDFEEIKDDNPSNK